MATETLYVNAFSAATQNWNTHTGVSPYLQAAAGNAITAFTDHVVDNSFDFANTEVADFATITSIKLKGQVAQNNVDHYAVLLLSGSSGGAWDSSVTVNDGEIGDGSWYDWASGDIKATISSLARINECAMSATKHNVAGAGTMSLRRVYLEITYTVAGGQQIKTLIEEYDY